METVRSCFGGNGNALPEDDDRDPLLPKHAHPNSHHFQTAGGSPEPPPSRVVNEGTKGKARRIIDFSETSDADTGIEGTGDEDEKPLLDKLVDAFAALSAGKVPSQDQVSRMVQILLHSDLLNPGSEADSRPALLNGTGPTSRRGRKVLEDVHTLLQAGLQFGMEKNDDNKLQDLIYNLTLLDTPRSDSLSQLKADANLPDVKLKPSVDLNQASDASKDAIGAGAEAAGKVRDQIPTSQEAKADSQILFHALRTVFTSFLTSHVFRFLLADILSILRQIAAKGAKDIAEAAAEVQQAAENVEERMEMSPNLVGTMGREKGKQREGEEGKTYAGVVADVDQAVDNTILAASGDERDLKELAQDAINAFGEAVGSAADTAKVARRGVSDKAEEWRHVGKQAKEEAGADLRGRLQQVLVEAQEDPASRNAFRAILILVRKYADKIEDVTETVVEAAEQVGDDIYSQTGLAGSAKFGVGISDPMLRQGDEDADKSTYPPPSSLYPSTISDPSSSTPQQRQEGEGSPASRVLKDAKIMLERSAQGTSFDGLLNALGRLVQDVNEAPSQLRNAADESANIGGGVEVDFDVGFGKGGMDRGGRANGLMESTSTTSVDTIRPAIPSADKAKAGKKKKGKGQTQGLSTGQEIPMATPQEVHEDPDMGEEKQPDAIRTFFRHLGLYLDRAMDEPGYITSRRGQGESERLWDEGVALVSVVEEVAEDIGEGLVEGSFGHSGKPRKLGVHADVKASRADGEVDASKEKVADEATELKRRFRRDAREVVLELEKVVETMEGDKSTMKLLHAIGSLSTSLSDLFGEPSPAIRKGKMTAKGLVKRAMWSSMQWPEWLGWALPKIMKLVPVNAIPIPSLEAKSESGGWEAGLYALFVRGNVLQRQRQQGNKDGWKYASDRTPRGGLETTLVPDRVVVTEWTEVVVDMPDGPTANSTARDVPSTSATPRVEMTSRVKAQLDGVRAKVKGLGYFFRYSGSWFGYEDEGILNVDIGMGKKHGGLGCVVEVEAKGERGRSDDPLMSSSFLTGNSGRTSPGPSPTTILSTEGIGGEGLEGEGVFASVPEIAVGKEANEMETDSVTQGTFVTANRPREETPSSTTLQTELEDLERAGLEPLFKVVDVHVEMTDVKVRLEKSKHWILNKMLVQPFAGRTVAQVVKRLLQEHLKDKLEDLALGLSRVKLEAELNALRRKEKEKALRLGARRERVARMVREGRWDESEIDRLYDLAEGSAEEEDGVTGSVQDWLNALVKQGSRIMESRHAKPEREHREGGTRTRTDVDVSRRGVVYHQETVVDEHTPPSPSPSPQQAVMFNKKTGKMEPVTETVSGSEGEHAQSESEDTAVEGDLTVAVGGGAQLFGDKEVPYGTRNDDGDFVTEGSRLVDAVNDAANGAAGEAMGTAAHIGTRWNARRSEETSRGKGWESKAFDF